MHEAFDGAAAAQLLCGGREEGAVGAAGTVENARVEAARARETDDGVSTTTGSISYPGSSAAAGNAAITNDYCAASTWMSSPTHKNQQTPHTIFNKFHPCLDSSIWMRIRLICDSMRRIFCARISLYATGCAIPVRLCQQKVVTGLILNRRIVFLQPPLGKAKWFCILNYGWQDNDPGQHGQSRAGHSTELLIQIQDRRARS